MVVHLPWAKGRETGHQHGIRLHGRHLGLDVGGVAQRGVDHQANGDSVFVVLVVGDDHDLHSLYAVLPSTGYVVLTILAKQWFRSNPWLVHHSSAPAEVGKVMPATVTQKLGTENVDHSPDHSSRAW